MTSLKRRHRGLVENHLIVQTEDADFQSLVKALQQFLPTDGSPSGESDLRQIAHTIAADIQVFVTRDAALRSQSDQRTENLG
jgi:hypothetical protein